MTQSDRWIRIAATAAVVLLALICFGISYGHVYDLAIRLGEDELTAQTYAVTIDGLLITGALVGLYCSRYRLEKPRLARTALTLGIGATLIANVAHGLNEGIAGAIFAGWPAVALLVASELLVWLIGAAHAMQARQVVIVEGETDQEANVLSRTLTLLANNRSISAAAVGRELGVSYPQALALTKRAREMLDD